MNLMLFSLISFSGITGINNIALLIKESTKDDMDKVSLFILSFVKSYNFDGTNTKVSLITYGGKTIQTSLSFKDGVSSSALSRALKSIVLDTESPTSTLQDAVDEALNSFSILPDTKKTLILFTNKKDNLPTNSFKDIERKNVNFIPVFIGADNVPDSFKNNLPDSNIIKTTDPSSLGDVYSDLEQLFREKTGKDLFLFLQNRGQTPYT